MELRKSALVTIAFMTIIAWQSVPLEAQKALNDTSDYLPYFVVGALEYNLILASEKGNAAEVERLIKRGAEIDSKTDEGATPLIFAVANKRSEAAKVLLYYGADPNLITNMNETPLMIAVRNQDDQLAEVLIRYGADVNFKDRNYCTPLHYSSIYGSLVMTDMLLYYDAEIETKAEDGTTPLMAAIWSGYVDVADLLIQRGANMEARDINGFTPFLIAAQNGDTTMMAILRAKGVDIFEVNRNGSSAMDLAIKTDQPQVIDLLVKWDGKWITSYPGPASPYEVAAKYRRSEIIKALEKYGFRDRYKIRPENLEVSIDPITNLRDYYTGFHFSFREPLHGIGIIAGIDTKLWYTKGYVKQGEHLYYQYMDKSSFAYTGLFKDIPLTDNIYKGNVFFSGTIKGGYYFANEFKGTDINPGGKVKIVPSLGLKWISKNIVINIAAEYQDTGFDLMAPVWCRIGIGYNLPFDNIKVQPKIIKWY